MDLQIFLFAALLIYGALFANISLFDSVQIFVDQLCTEISLILANQKRR